MFRWLVPAALCAIFLIGGVVHGLWTDRWQHSADRLVAEASARLDRVPFQAGYWKGKAYEWDEVEQGSVGERVLTRQYSNELNGNTIAVLLACGYSRNLWMFHTPIDCYPARGFSRLGPVKTQSIVLEDPPIKADFFVADFYLDKGSQSKTVRVFWSWSGAGEWLAPEYPRFALGRYASLNKFYVLRELLKADEPLDNDPCVHFIREFLPELNRSLFAAP